MDIINTVSSLVGLMSKYGPFMVFTLICLFLYVKANQKNLTLVVQLIAEDNATKTELANAINNLRTDLEKGEIRMIAKIADLKAQVEKSCLMSDSRMEEMSKTLGNVSLMVTLKGNSKREGDNI